MNRWASWIGVLSLLHCKAAPDKAEVAKESAPDGPAREPAPAPTLPASPLNTSPAPVPLPASAPAPATEWLPLAVGNAWTLADRAGALEIRVARSERFLGRDCFVVEWTSDGKTYQSEHWYVDAAGIWVARRHVHQQELSLDKAWPFLKSPLAAGTEWQADFTATAGSLGSKKMSLSIRAEGEERVEVPAGSYPALRVDFRDSATRYRRWFARGIGLVREDAYAGEKLLNSKELTTVKLVPLAGGAPVTVAGAGAVGADGFETIPGSSGPLRADFRQVDSTAASAAIEAYRETLSSRAGGVFSARVTGSFLDDGEDEVVLEMPAEGGQELIVMRKGTSGHYTPVLRTQAFQKIDVKADLQLGPRRRVLYLCATTESESLRKMACGFLGQGSFRDASEASKPDPTKSDVFTVDPKTCGVHQSILFQSVQISAGRIFVGVFVQPKRGNPAPAPAKTGTTTTPCASWSLDPVKPYSIEYGLRAGKLERVTPAVPPLDAIIARYR